MHALDDLDEGPLCALLSHDVVRDEKEGGVQLLLGLRRAWSLCRACRRPLKDVYREGPSPDGSEDSLLVRRCPVCAINDNTYLDLDASTPELWTRRGAAARNVMVRSVARFLSVPPHVRHLYLLGVEPRRVKGRPSELFDNVLEDVPVNLNLSAPDLSRVVVFVARRSTAVTDNLLTQLAPKCSLLRVLDVSKSSGQRVSDVGLLAVAAHCLSLTELNIGYITDSVTDHGVCAIAQACRKLRVLNVAGTTAVRDPGIEAVAQHCPDLADLNVAMTFGRISDGALLEVAAHCTKLVSLSVSGTRVSDASMVAIARRCVGLTAVDVSKTNKVTNESIAAIAQYCPGLRHLNVSNTEGISDASIAAVANRCSQLLSLDVSCTQNWDTTIGHASLDQVAKGCGSLQFLDLSHLSRVVNDDTLRAFAAHCPNLTWLNLQTTPGISDQAVEFLWQRCRHLRRVEGRVKPALSSAALTSRVPRYGTALVNTQ